MKYTSSNKYWNIILLIENKYSEGLSLGKCQSPRTYMYVCLQRPRNPVPVGFEKIDFSFK